MKVQLFHSFSTAFRQLFHSFTTAAHLELNGMRSMRSKDAQRLRKTLSIDTVNKFLNRILLEALYKIMCSTFMFLCIHTRVVCGKNASRGCLSQPSLLHYIAVWHVVFQGEHIRRNHKDDLSLN